MRLMVASEKGITASTGAILAPNTMKQVFATIGLKPWSDADLRTMRKAILIEGLGAETAYTKAYITANISFKNRKTSRIYLKDTLKHTKQLESLSCEANSMTDFFNYYRGRAGVARTNENDVFALLPKDESPPELVKENGISVRKWSDPDKVFV